MSRGDPPVGGLDAAHELQIAFEHHAHSGLHHAAKAKCGTALQHHCRLIGREGDTIGEQVSVHFSQPSKQAVEIQIPSLQCNGSSQAVDAWHPKALHPTSQVSRYHQNTEGSFLQTAAEANPSAISTVGHRWFLPFV